MSRSHSFSPAPGRAAPPGFRRRAAAAPYQIVPAGGEISTDSSSMISAPELPAMIVDGTGAPVGVVPPLPAGSSALPAVGEHSLPLPQGIIGLPGGYIPQGPVQHNTYQQSMPQAYDYSTAADINMQSQMMSNQQHNQQISIANQSGISPAVMLQYAEQSQAHNLGVNQQMFAAAQLAVDNTQNAAAAYTSLVHGVASHGLAELGAQRDAAMAFGANAETAAIAEAERRHLGATSALRQQYDEQARAAHVQSESRFAQYRASSQIEMAQQLAARDEHVRQQVIRMEREQSERVLLFYKLPPCRAAETRRPM